MSGGNKLCREERDGPFHMAARGIRGAGLPVKILLLLICALLLFYAYVLFLSLDSWKRADQELRATVYDKLFYYMSDLESEVVRINLAQEQFSGKLEINLLSLDTGNVFSEYQRLEMIHDVQTYLSQFFYTNNILKNTKLHIRNMKKSVDCFGGIRDLDVEEYSYLSQHSRETGGEVCQYEGKLLIIQPYPVSVINEREPLYIASCEIDRSILEKQMKNLSDSSISDIVLAADDKTWFAGNEELYDTFIKKADGMAGDKIYSEKEGKYYYVIKVNSQVFGASVYSFLPEDTIRENNFSGILLFILFSAAASAVILLVYYILDRILGKPMRTLMGAFDVVKQGQVGYQIQHTREDEFAYLYNNFNEMISNINTLNHEVAEQEKLVVEAELKQLQYQINPHFLYNSLYLIYRLAKKGENEMIEELSLYLGGYYRYITKSTSKLVPVRDEIEHCRKYVNIQKMRFMDRIDISFGELDHKYDKLMIPVLIFQPVIENAFEHGVKNAEKGIIDIYFHVQEPYVTFIVEDNGDGMEKEEVKQLYRQFNSEEIEGVSGIVNVYRRVKGYFGQDGDIQIEKSRYGGTKVLLKIYSR